MGVLDLSVLDDEFRNRELSIREILCDVKFREDLDGYNELIIQFFLWFKKLSF